MGSGTMRGKCGQWEAPGGPGTHTEGAGPEQEQEVAPPPAGGGAVTPVSPQPHPASSGPVPRSSLALPAAAHSPHSLSSNLAACLRDTFPTWKQRCLIRQVLAQVWSPGETDLPHCPPPRALKATAVSTWLCGTTLLPTDPGTVAGSFTATALVPATFLVSRNHGPEIGTCAKKPLLKASRTF